MLDGYFHPCSTLQYVSVCRVPLAVIYLLTFVTALDAAALNKTGPVASQVLPADQLQPGDVKADAPVLKVDQVGTQPIIVLCISSVTCYQ